MTIIPAITWINTNTCTEKLKQWMQKLKCSLREACLEKKNAHHAKENELRRASLLSSSKPQATGRVTSSYSSSSWLLLKTGKGIPKSRKETPHISSTALSSIAYWHGGNWIFPLPPRATNWNCPANLCPHEWLSQQRSKDLKPTQTSASATDPKHLDSHGRESKGSQQLLKPFLPNQQHELGRCSWLSQHSCSAPASPCRKQTAPGTRGRGCGESSVCRAQQQQMSTAHLGKAWHP